MPRSFRVAQRLLWCLALLPAVFTAWLISCYSVDVLYGDEWGLAHFFERIADGSLTFGDLLLQQNEFRQTFPYLVIIGLGWLMSWDVRYEMWFSFLLVCLVSFNLYRISKVVAPHLSQPQRLLMFAATNLLIFSTIQFESWFNGIQIVYFAPIACLTSCIHISYSRFPLTIKLLLCLLLSTVSTFSSANGLVCWVAALPVLVLANHSQGKARLAVLSVAWVIAFALNLTGYLYGYHKPEIQPSTTEVLSRPFAAILFFLSVLGAPLTPGKGFPAVLLATALGAGLVTCFVFAGVVSRRHSRDAEFVKRMIAGLMIGFYSVLTAAMITVGRLGYGVEQALAPRYTTFTLYLAVGLIYVAPPLLSKFSGKLHAVFNRVWLLKLTVAVLLILHFVVSAQAILRTRVLHARLLHAKACLTLINVVQGECVTRLLFPSREYVLDKANSLDRLGYLTPGLINSKSISAFVENKTAPAVGAFDDLTRMGEGDYQAAGHAVLPGRGEAADAVLLAYEDGGEPVVFAITRTRRAEIGVLEMLRDSTLEQSKWRIDFSLELLPPRPVRLSAWAFDAETGTAFSLAGEHNAHPLPGSSS